MTKIDDTPSAPLRNPRHERIAQAVAGGMKMPEAMAKEGYADPARNSTRMAKRPEIAARIAYLQGQVAEALHITKKGQTLKLQQAFDIAQEQKNVNGMVGAVNAQNKLHGLIVDKALLPPVKPIEDMSADELRIFLGEDADDAGSRAD